MPASIELQSVRLSRGKRSITEPLTLSVAPGECVAIVGPSGVGKSTLLQAIAGLVPVDGGTILVDGQAVNRARASVTMMLQRPALLPWASAHDNVLLGARLSGSYARDRSAAERHAKHLLERVGLSDRSDARPVELSGGEQQRVALARALAPRPSLLLLDEPFSALDPETRARLRQDVTTLARDTGLTLLLVTHDLADATALCRRIVRLGGKPARIEADLYLDKPSNEPATIQELSAAA